MKLLEHWRKFYYKSCSDFLNNKKNEKYAYFRYFASFWVHAIQKQMFEINDRYFEFQENELDLYLKLRSLFNKKVVIPFLDLCVCTTCTLKCKDCTQWMPYIKEKKIFSAEQIIANINQLFNYIDYIHIVSPLDGEPFMNKEFDKIMDYLKKMQDEGKIGYIRVVTNGTIFPNENVLKYFHFKHIFLLISEYGKVLNEASLCNKNKLIDYFRNNNLKYYSPSDFLWTDLGTPDTPHNKEIKDLKNTFNTCFVRNCVSLFDGTIYRCPRAYAISKKCTPRPEEIIEISKIKSKNDMRKKLKSFYSIDYLSACDFCLDDSQRTKVEAAIQCE